MKKAILVLALAFIGWQFWSGGGEVELGPGVMAADTPAQQKLSSPDKHRVDDYTLTEVASFDITAKVLAKKNYRTGRESDLSPTDLALGWGNMSDERILKDIKISQRGRFYFWRVESFPIPRREIETHSANMHLIPANDYIKDVINDIKTGDIIELSGSLVNVKADDGWRWKTSQTRNDTGGGACEIIWVERLRIVSP